MSDLDRRPAPLAATPEPPAQDLAPHVEHAGLAPTTARTAAGATQHYLQAARAESTRRAYARDWANFASWCAEQRDAAAALPAQPATVAAYLADLAATHRPVTLVRRCSAISAVHQAAGHDSPTTSSLVRTTLAGIRRVHGVAPAAKDPLLAHQVRRLLDALPSIDELTGQAGAARGREAPAPAKAEVSGGSNPLSQVPPATRADHLAGSKRLLAARDRALLLIGFYGALRRSELVALEVADVEVNDHGLVLALRRGKTDQEGAGRRIALLHTGSADSCPTEAYVAWLSALDAALAHQAAVTVNARAHARWSVGAKGPGTVEEALAWAAAGGAEDLLATDAERAQALDDTGLLRQLRRRLPAPPSTATAPGRVTDHQTDGGWVVPVFRAVTRHGAPVAGRLSDRTVARVVQRTAAAAGLGHLDLAGHSLRAGFATSAAAAGKSERSIMKQTGHTSLPMVRRYIREGSLYRDNPTDGLTL